MPHVSTKKLDSKTLEEIYKILIETITSKDVSKKEQERFLNELFTKTEKVMLGKRLMAVEILSRGISTYKTSQLLGLSDTTTCKIFAQMGNKKFDKVMKMCSIYRKGPLGRYIDNLLKPLPKYGTAPTSLFKK